ncbi:hypothetical protein CAPTEDRAFT_149656 [Capitella teleta]|uniref:EF-hand domain-containing protein n=1 Tax=Capitella teleta TaxID=283909 RepID=R7U401_CAPTE|nr:hypothetical protein CAPTEDRAFT_149656 [Capitella teleta]|eukprot:ELT97885.1 hypothetical protein CAPTEDRAFT_149656 [Capitella teleta]
MGNNSSGKHLRPEVMSDLTEATRFSEQDIRQWHQTFMKDFPSGQLGIDQFKDVYVQHFPNGDATSFAEHVFRTFDKDLDHHLDFREFLTAVSITAHGDAEERLRWAFRMYDIDESGFVKREECEEIISAILALRSGSVTSDPQTDAPNDLTMRLFNEYDADADGWLSEEELRKAIFDQPRLKQLLSFDQRRY